MSSAIQGRSLRSVLVTVIFAPLILLERSRGVWRWLLVILYGAIAVLALGYALRTRNLARIPDLDASFHIDAFRDAGPDDAYPLYLLAIERYESPTRRTEDQAMQLLGQVQALRFNAGSVSPEVQAWIEKNRPALELWREATERSGFGYHPGSERGIGSEWIEYGVGTNATTGAPMPIRQFNLERGMLRWLAEREAARLRRAGDAAGAWRWIRALLRYSRHVGMRAGFSDRLAAVELHEAACDLAESWAINATDKPALLHRALDDVLEVGKMTPPLSDTLKADYPEALRLLDHPTAAVVNRVAADYARNGDPAEGDHPPDREEVRLAQGHASGPDPDPYRGYLPDLRAGIIYNLRHEPETSRRLVGQVYANWLAHCDKPPRLRPATVSPFELFDAPPAIPGMLPVPALIEELNGPRVARHVLSPWSDFEKTLGNERTRQAQLVVAIAEQLYLRERRTPVPTVRDLVGSYLKEIPEGYVDPLVQEPAAPLNRRGR